MTNLKTIDNTSFISSAQDVIQTEIDGLLSLKSQIGKSFTNAIDAIQTMKDQGRGRLIIAGIGKSGHVGRKINATLASTGTPSYYVHPGEASHGDLGMVTEHDIVLMISNSGENQELADLIHYTRRFNITLIAMTSREDSTLSKHADITLLLPQSKEACPNGMAPTTSTTMMMALGDALAVVLLENMGLSKEDFQVFHPGGKLGQQLLRVSDIMVSYDQLPLAQQNDTMDKAILILSEKNLGCALVLNETDTLCGIITDGDLKRHMDADLLTKSVKDVMSPSPKSISYDALAAEAVQIMTKTPDRYLTSLVVTAEDGTLTGLIRLQDCLQRGIA